MKRSKADIARENGRKSKGPITVAGKEKSSQNALRHGYTSHRAVLLTNESEQELREFSQIQFDELKPATPAQSLVVEEIIAAAWRLRRIWHAETAFIDMEMARQFKVPYDLEPIDQHMRTARAFESIAAKPQNQLLLLQRYARSLRIQHDRALRQLRDMQAAPPPPVAPPLDTICPNEPTPPPRAIHPQHHATRRIAMAYPGSALRLHPAPTPQPALRAAP
jgi:hypothetical protein